MTRTNAVLLIVASLLAFTWIIVDTIINPRVPKNVHVDWFCGTITDKNGTEPIKISVDTEMSFDFREPGKLELHRCTAGEK